MNAANYGMLGGGGIDGAIHRAAGPNLRKYNEAVHRCCVTGDAKVSPGYKLPAKWIISTVGPTTEDPRALRSCYESSLQQAIDTQIRSVAFCCISTGVYGYPLDKATHIALDTVRTWLNTNSDKVDRIIFVVFLQREEDTYHQLAPCYFPLEEDREEHKPVVVKSNNKRKLSV